MPELLKHIMEQARDAGHGSDSYASVIEVLKRPMSATPAPAAPRFASGPASPAALLWCTGRLTLPRLPRRTAWRRHGAAGRDSAAASPGT
ncbi:hypothetical protein [Microbispora sp. NPDC049633]|uniref:hypothetical protein n=1 Tax=Microbispora sp. NPDC049633 TaxID=3154355 RepID=UPI00343B39B2